MQLQKLNNRAEVIADLVTGCLKNDRLKQKQLFNLYKDAMFTTALRITGNKDLAHDVLQDAFIDVFRGIGDFRFESSLGTWIKTIVVRKALKTLKLERQHEPLEKAEKIETESDAPYFNVEELEKAIQSLPDASRASVPVN